ncbi:hypothetical protein [Rhizobium sp. BK176]|uniref:hypothetical protein n=1 Tax=Rhizobium sp. BK176 TaxID=2587071 RepID=UPI00216A3738|nr:hypothetical protein [Rhizobium sp. BK176]MCS4089006.1 putative YccA/Bax inhibitor family protein [Rhizobium sp. BK176]
MKLMRRVSGLVITAVGVATLAAVAWAIFVSASEGVLQYLGFGIIFGLMAVATGAAIALPSDVRR